MNAAEASRWARVAGVLLLVSFVAGGYGESYAPGKIAAARDFVGSVALFRTGFAAYIVEAICDLSLTAIFYVLLRPVSRTLALIAVCIGDFCDGHVCGRRDFLLRGGVAGDQREIRRRAGGG